MLSSAVHSRALFSMASEALGTTPGVQIHRFQTVLCPDSQGLTTPVHPRPEEARKGDPEWHG